MNKKQLRNVLSPLGQALRGGAAAQSVDLLGLRIECDRLYNGRGCVGFAWQAHFAAYSKETGKLVTGGNLSEIIDRLMIVQTKT